jgi:hypothetical protein
MRSLLIMAVVATAALLGGCQDKKPEPVPGPQSAVMQRTTIDTAVLKNPRLRSLRSRGGAAE